MSTLYFFTLYYSSLARNLRIVSFLNATHQTLYFTDLVVRSDLFLHIDLVLHSDLLFHLHEDKDILLTYIPSLPARRIVPFARLVGALR
jgi:hypothetical protein